jgi:hypothetical protein
MLPPVLHTRASSAAAFLVRREHHAERRQHDIERAVGERQVLGIGLLESDRVASAWARARPDSSSAGA